MTRWIRLPINGALPSCSLRASPAGSSFTSKAALIVSPTLGKMNRIPKAIRGPIIGPKAPPKRGGLQLMLPMGLISQDWSDAGREVRLLTRKILAIKMRVNVAGKTRI